ncbi:antibiotic biosynthesis monooxygenase family protein [Nocardia terpenica]|uniref:Antibiotic biosynthesis monooxygenase n=1 Tax=Nocardia terpenica TaxID=455432 RepID=A0A6G9YZT3_9NOCA|nr:antibiotic biosynthesis monooxygenase [Nocardia terpenica]QIS18476.1 antibiotic biosynthesis monooxygenase [Nocardia terpenica]
MPFIDLNSGNLIVVNMFKTDSSDKRDRLLEATNAIVDSADYPGWVSSTVHLGQDKLATLNLIQWKSIEALQEWYAGEIFKHHDMSVYLEMTTLARLLQSEVALIQQHPATDSNVVEISPDRDDFTTVEILDVEQRSQRKLIDAISAGHEWLIETPGYRSQSVLRGVLSRSANAVRGFQTVETDRSFLIIYSQWASKDDFDAFRTTPEHKKSPVQRAMEIKRNALTASSDWNTYTVVNANSAVDPS